MERTETWARCTPTQAAVLAPYDHHRALFGNRWGIILTNHWLELSEAPADAPAEFLLHVVFTVGPQFPRTDTQGHVAVLRHPAVPREIQSLLNELDYLPGPDN